jgi:hypothetical protein
MALGITESCIWLFQCQPFMSNFNYNVDEDWCIPLDPCRYLWIGLSIPIDFAILAIPFEILRQTKLQRHEKRVLMMVFSANLLGTVAWYVPFELINVWSLT